MIEQTSQELTVLSFLLQSIYKVLALTNKFYLRSRAELLLQENYCVVYGKKVYGAEANTQFLTPLLPPKMLRISR